MSYDLLDTTSGKSTRGPIDLEGHSVEVVIFYLIECKPEIKDTGELVFSPKQPLPYIRRWIIGDKEISIYKKGDQLRYKLLDHLNNERKGPLDSAINHLTCQPEVSEKGEVTFSQSPSAQLEWTFRNKEIKLLKNDQDELIWQLFDKSTKTISQVPFRESSLRSDSLSTICGIDRSNSLSMSDYLDKYSSNQNPKSCLKLFKDCVIERLEVVPGPHSSAYRLKAVHAEKIIGRSELNPNVSVDCKNWAVTLANTGRSILTNPLTWGGHAAIIIEGREKGAKFRRKAHFICMNNKADMVVRGIIE